MPVNNQYKSSVFALLFSTPAALRELYDALSDIPLPPDISITVNTLEGVLYRTFLNDLSFLAGDKLVVLIEHQSTINPNMAIRLLMYLARLYEKITAGQNLYRRKQLVIPRPECIVLYNGADPYPDQQTITLSDAFAPALRDALPCLELRVKVYNINRGRNESVLKRSETLEGYSAFIAKAREFEAAAAKEGRTRRLSDDEKQEAMKRAITWCIAHKILKPFLETHGSEVVNMLMSEWKLEDALVVEREEALEEGFAKGEVIGREEGEEKKQHEIAAKALAEGLSLEIIQKITGLGIDEIITLS